MIHVLETELNQKGLSPEDQSSIRDRLQGFYQIETQQAQVINFETMYPAQAEATQRAGAMATPIPVITQTLVTGILDDPSAPYPGSVFKVLNGWQDFYNGGYVTVYAGLYTLHPSQGVLIIVNDSKQTFLELPAPMKNGGLKIQSYQDGKLFITTTTNYQYIFDLSLMAFVDNKGKPLGPVATTAPFIQTPTYGSPYPPP